MYFKSSFIACLFMAFIISFLAGDVQGQEKAGKNQVKNAFEISLPDYFISDTPSDSIVLLGDPEVIKIPGGEAVLFDGKDDGIRVDFNPLNRLNEFTIEIILRVDSGGNFEQRYLHLGEVNGPRILMELRAVDQKWYLDTFISTPEEEETLVCENLTHTVGEWYHIAFVVDNGLLINYVNGQKELESSIEMIPVNNGQASFGMRQDERSWFKGAIGKIKISPKAISPEAFIAF